MNAVRSALGRLEVDLKRRLFSAVAQWPGILWRFDPRRKPPFAAEFSQGGAAIAIWQAKRRLYVYQDGVLERSYRVGVGGWRARTPRGHFRIEQKIRDPAWTVPDIPVRFGNLSGTTVPSGHADHRLGPRWMQIRGGIGIHGGPCGPFGIGSTTGCVKLSNTDVIELFECVEVGVPVVIV